MGEVSGSIAHWELRVVLWTALFSGDVRRDGELMQQPQENLEAHAPSEGAEQGAQETIGKGPEIHTEMSQELQNEGTSKDEQSGAVGGTDDGQEQATNIDQQQASDQASDAHSTPNQTGHEDEQQQDEQTTAPAEQDPFEGVPDILRKALERRGFNALTPVQSGALVAQREGRDLRLSSQTGSGKTVALGLVMAPGLMAAADTRGPGPRGLVITPTRELAAQVRQELAWLFEGVQGLTLDCVMGGTIVGEERRRLRSRPTLLVGTPGRLLDHVGSGALDLSGVEAVVLDEGDQMLDMGFRDELEAILDATPEGRHMHLVSATFSPDVLRLAERYQHNALAVEGTALGAAHGDIDHVAHTVRPNTRYPALVNVVSTAGAERCLVFVKTRAEAAQLAERLTGDGFSAGYLSGDLAQSQRARTLAAFRRGHPCVLVATDVAARGLDVPDVALVVNYAMPFDLEAYTHRSGRTGRAGRSGVSVLLVPGSKERRVRRLMEDAGVDLDFRPIPGAAEVAQALAGQARRQAEALLAANPEPAPEMLAEAKNLVGERDPIEVLAVLLGGDRSAVLRNVRSVTGATERPSREERDTFRSRDRDFSGGAPKREVAPRPSAEDFVTFVINWGFRAGANPSRILALACRRGGVDRTALGAIRMDAFDSYFEVTKESAEAFELAATAPDERDPDVLIRKAGPGETGPPPREFGGGGGRRRGGFDRGRGGSRRGGFGRGRGGPRSGTWSRGGGRGYRGAPRGGGFPSRGASHGAGGYGGYEDRGGSREDYGQHDGDRPQGGYRSRGGYRGAPRRGGYGRGGYGGERGGYEGADQQGGGERPWRDTGFRGTDYPGSSTGGPRRGGYRRGGPRRGRGGYRPRR